MSFSVNGSNTTNPFATVQSLWQQASSTSGTQTQTDPLSALLAAVGQQGAGTTSATSGTTSSTSGPSAATGSTSPLFGPQMLQALLALQSSGSDPQSLVNQFANAASNADPGSTQQSQGHHHHHHMGAGASGGQSPLNTSSATLSGASSQTTTNANGTTTTSITYANGSSVSMTNAASGGSTQSDTFSSAAGGATVTGNNLIEQLIQMQAQLLSPTSAQSITTA